MVFELGKCYQHTTGQRFKVIAEVDTYMYGPNVLIAETDKGDFIPLGRDEAATMNYSLCDDFTLDTE